MISKKKTRLTEAQTFLKQKIQSGKWTPGEKVPSIAHLSRESGLSTNTIWHAVRILAQQKVLVVRRNRGMYYGEPAPRGLSSPTTQSGTLFRAEDVCRRLTKDIVEGRFSNQNILPTYKELAYRYSTGYRTLKQALGRLVERNRIEPCKKRYAITKHLEHKSYTSIVLVLKENWTYMMERSYFKTRFIIFLQHLEKQCSERGLHLQQHIYNGRFGQTKGFNEAIGFIVWTDFGFEDISRFLVTYKRPVVFIDEQLTLSNTLKHPSIYFFRTADFNAGYAIGNYLLETGHRKAGYLSFSSTTGSGWSQKRFEGMVAAFEHAGLGTSAVVPIFLDNANRPSGAVLNRKALKAVHSQWEYELVSDDNNLSRLIQFVDKRIHDVPIRARFMQGALESQSKLITRQQFGPYIKKALHNSNITALVGEEDSVAIYAALDFLNQARIAVPAAMSVAGFDNQIEAFANNLTSYDFDIPAGVGKIIDILCWPGHSKKKNPLANATIMVEGFIAVRGSTGPNMKV